MMKVTILDPKQKKPNLTVGDLLPGTLFEMHTKRDAHYIGLVVRGSRGIGNNIVRLNGEPAYTVPIEESCYKTEEVNIINSVELSTK
jgi:hypothetical protein